MKKIGRKLFTVTNWIVFSICMVAVCAVDSESWFSTIVCALCMAYLGCALYISNKIEEKKGQCKK